jgi:predicted Fe-S protein YdhL (DUF1289 family)
MTTQPAPASPCINVCVLDQASGTCTGCGRTIDEIARWGGMSAAEQWQVVARLERERVRAGTQAARVTATPAG